MNDRVRYFLTLAKTDSTLSDDDKVELQQILLEFREKYDEGLPLVTDSEYDILEELAVYEGEIRSSTESANYGERVKHPIDIMRGTLDKVYYLTSDEPRTNKSRKSLPEWIHSAQEIVGNKYNLLDEEVIVTAKYDGMSCVLYVDDNGKCLWLTRGDTGRNEGVDIGHIMNGMNVPRIPNTATQFELLIENDKLAELNERYSTTYKNTRALTAGIIRTKEVDYRAQFITPIPLKLYKDGVLRIHPDQFSKYPSIRCKLREVDKIRKFADNNRNVLGKFRTDGAVITLVNPELRNILGRKDNINQWEVAYKFTEESSYSIIQDISFQVSEMGVITPVAEITPVVMKGNTVSRISLHNKARFDEMNLRYQDTVKVLYDIIPYCTLDDHCEKLNSLSTQPRIPFPTTCPMCGSKLDLLSPIVCCTNQSCPSVKIGRVINYLSCLNCKGIGPEIVKRLFELNVITDIPSIYRIGSTKQQRVIMDSHGFGDLKMKMILANIKNISKLKDYEFFGALGFKGLNKQFFTWVFNQYPLQQFLSDTFDKNWDTIFKNVLSIRGISDKKANLLIKSLKADRKLIERCIKYIKLIPTYQTASADIKGVVFTGFRDSNLASELTKRGYTIQDNITKQTVLVIAKDSSFNSGSISKAIKNNIRIITREEAEAVL